MARASKASKAVKKAAAEDPKKQATAKKAAPKKKVSAKKTSAKKTPPKKATPEKTTPDKTAAKKASPKKASTGRASPKKTSAKTKSTSTEKKSGGEGSSAKRAGTKSPTSTTADQAQPTNEKAPVKKATPEKAAAKKAAPKKTKSPFDAKFLEQMKKLLQTERDTYERQAANLRAEADAMIADIEPGDVQFDEESGEGDTIAVERNRDLALSAKALEMIEEIDHAMTKFESGTYGICEISGEPIPRERLEAIPWAREKVEFKVGGFGRR